VDDVKPPARQTTLRDERAQVTRRRIEDAARRLFLRDGYAATTLTAIATEAGVAVQTIYAVHASKAGVLRALRQRAVDQPEANALFALAMEEPDPRRKLELFARSIRERWERSGDVVSIHRDAATADTVVRAGAAEALERRRGGIRSLAATLGAHLRHGIDVPRAAALLDALTLHELYAELVDVAGWTPDAYEAWLAAALVRELLAAT
jgi:AcrR family transcriptional regulator